MAVAGDSVGGNMTAAVTLLAKQRHGPALRYQVLFYPVTDADFDDGSYQEFANGPWLTKPAMEWFWNAYAPNVEDRKNVTASPLRATIESLKGLPPALVITDENDVLRDEGEAYAKKLIEAGVRVTATRYVGTIHDFVMLNALADSPATRAAIRQATDALRSKCMSAAAAALRGRRDENNEAILILSCVRLSQSPAANHNVSLPTPSAFLVAGQVGYGGATVHRTALRCRTDLPVASLTASGRPPSRRTVSIGKRRS
jgi:hypothetical protein